MSLSDKQLRRIDFERHNNRKCTGFLTKDVKEAVKELKDMIIDKVDSHIWIQEEIDKIFGDKLSGEGK